MTQFPRAKTGTGPRRRRSGPTLRRVPRGAAHRRHLRDHRGHQRGYAPGVGRLVQPRPGHARGRAAAGRAAADRRAADPRRRPGVRAGRRPVGAARGDRRLLQRAVPPRHAQQVLRRERRRLRRWPRRRSPASRRRSATSTSATSCPTTPPTRSCSTSSGCSRRSRSCSSASAATRSPAADLRREVLGRGLGAILASNPCNPTGKVIGGEDLAEWVAVARELDCTLILDEFYSHYIWRPDLVAQGGIDRDRGALRRGRRPRSGGDPRRADQELALPGLARDLDGRRRKKVIEARGDGRLVPRRRRLAAAAARGDRAAVADGRDRRDRGDPRAFGKKRARLLNGLRDLGFTVDLPPEGTFYVWASAPHLPPSISDGMAFFRAALDRKVITVPGEFFDVEPGKRRGGRASRFRHHVRFSFGPPMAQLELALERIRELIAESRSRRATSPTKLDGSRSAPAHAAAGFKRIAAQAVVVALVLRAELRRRRDAVRARGARATPTR